MRHAVIVLALSIVLQTSFRFIVFRSRRLLALDRTRLILGSTEAVGRPCWSACVFEPANGALINISNSIPRVTVDKILARAEVSQQAIVKLKIDFVPLLVNN
jgi:hypothetical protein